MNKSRPKTARLIKNSQSKKRLKHTNSGIARAKTGSKTNKRNVNSFIHPLTTDKKSVSKLENLAFWSQTNFHNAPINKTSVLNTQRSNKSHFSRFSKTSNLQSNLKTSAQTGYEGLKMGQSDYYKLSNTKTPRNKYTAVYIDEDSPNFGPNSNFAKMDQNGYLASEAQIQPIGEEIDFLSTIDNCIDQLENTEQQINQIGAHKSQKSQFKTLATFAQKAKKSKQMAKSIVSNTRPGRRTNKKLNQRSYSNLDAPGQNLNQLTGQFKVKNSKSQIEEDFDDFSSQGSSSIHNPETKHIPALRPTVSSDYIAHRRDTFKFHLDNLPGQNLNSKYPNKPKNAPNLNLNKLIDSLDYANVSVARKFQFNTPQQLYRASKESELENGLNREIEPPSGSRVSMTKLGQSNQFGKSKTNKFSSSKKLKKVKNMDKLKELYRARSSQKYKKLDELGQQMAYLTQRGSKTCRNNHSNHFLNIQSDFQKFTKNGQTMVRTPSPINNFNQVQRLNFNHSTALTGHQPSTEYGQWTSSSQALVKELNKSSSGQNLSQNSGFNYSKSFNNNLSSKSFVQTSQHLEGQSKVDFAIRIENEVLNQKVDELEKKIEQGWMCANYWRQKCMELKNGADKGHFQSEIGQNRTNGLESNLGQSGGLNAQTITNQVPTGVNHQWDNDNTLRMPQKSGEMTKNRTAQIQNFIQGNLQSQGFSIESPQIFTQKGSKLFKNVQNQMEPMTFAKDLQPEPNSEYLNKLAQTHKFGQFSKDFHTGEFLSGEGKDIQIEQFQTQPNPVNILSTEISDNYDNR